LKCKAGSGSPLDLMMQKRYETEVTKLSQSNPSFFAVISFTRQKQGLNFIQVHKYN